MPDDAPALEPMSEEEAMLQEYGATGLAAGGQMMELYRAELAAQGVVTSAELERVRNGERVKVAGLVVVRQSPGTAKGFVFLTLEDETGLINLIVRPDVFQAGRALWARSLILIAEGRVQRAHGRVDVLAEGGRDL
jgi:error-prone DNA polymerase